MIQYFQGWILHRVVNSGRKATAAWGPSDCSFSLNLCKVEVGPGTSEWVFKRLSITCSSVLFSMSVSMSSVQAKSNKRLRKRLLIEKDWWFQRINITVRFDLPPILFNWAFCFNLQAATQIGAFKGRSGSGKRICLEHLGPELKAPGWRPSLSSVTFFFLSYINWVFQNAFLESP